MSEAGSRGLEVHSESAQTGRPSPAAGPGLVVAADRGNNGCRRFWSVRGNLVQSATVVSAVRARRTWRIRTYRLLTCLTQRWRRSPAWLPLFEMAQRLQSWQVLRTCP